MPTPNLVSDNLTRELSTVGARMISLCPSALARNQVRSLKHRYTPRSHHGPLGNSGRASFYMKHSSFLVSCLRGATIEEKPCMNHRWYPTRPKKLRISDDDLNLSHLRSTSTLAGCTNMFADYTTWPRITCSDSQNAYLDSLAYNQCSRRVCMAIQKCIS